MQCKCKNFLLGGGGGRVGVWGVVECCIARNVHNANNFCFSESVVPAFSLLRTVRYCGPGMIFFGSGSYFSVGFGSFINFSNININFTFVFPSCKCVCLHIMTRYR
jgi:hypothetical protein